MIKVLTGSSLFALSPYQIMTLKEVDTISRKYTNYPSTIEAICLTESSLGKNKYNSEGSFGVMQVQVETAKYIGAKVPEIGEMIHGMDDSDLVVALLTDTEISVAIASAYFEYNRKRYGYFQAISRYNGGTKNYTYYNRVKRNIKKVIRWRKKYGI